MRRDKREHFPQATSAAIRKEDVVGISSLVFSNNGDSFYLCSSSELQRVSVSACSRLEGGGRVEVVRPPENGGEVEVMEVSGGDTDSAADRQNQQNEVNEAGGDDRRSPR